MNDIILSVDCSNKWTCLGLSIDGEPAGEINRDLGRKQASKLPFLVSELLAKYGIEFDRLSHIAVTVGPGYFTGLRIGMAYAAALACALNREVIALSSLEVVLRTIPGWQFGVKAVLIAASRELAFSALWQDGKQVLEEKERTRDDIQREAMDRGTDCDFWAVDDTRLFASSNRNGVTFLSYPSGAAAARLAWEQRSKSIKPDSLRARYLREPGLGRSL